MGIIDTIRYIITILNILIIAVSFIKGIDINSIVIGNFDNIVHNPHELSTKIDTENTFFHKSKTNSLIVLNITLHTFFIKFIYSPINFLAIPADNFMDSI